MPPFTLPFTRRYTRRLLRLLLTAFVTLSLLPVSSALAATGDRDVITAIVSEANNSPILTAVNATVTVDEGQTATNSGTVTDSNSTSITFSASVGTVAGNLSSTFLSDLTTGGRWRTSSVIKSADADGNNVYGTDGYGLWGLSGPETIVNPAYATITRGATTFLYGGNGGYLNIDNPANPAGSQVGTGVVYTNPGGTNPTTFFTVTFSQARSVRMGILVDNADVAAISPATLRLRQTAGGSLDTGYLPAGTAASRNRSVDYYFFDIVGQPGDTFEVSGNNDPGHGSNGIGGVFFDTKGWEWSYLTTDGSVQSQTVIITGDDGATTSNLGTTTFDLVVNNVAPSATFANGGAVTSGSAGSVSFSAPSDPSSVDTAAGFHYAYDFDNDGVFELGDGTYAGSGTSTTAAVPASYLAGRGNHVVRGRIIDKDDGVTDYTTTIVVTNAAPAANNGTLGVTEDIAATGNLSATDLEGDTLTYSVVTNGTKGTVAITNASTGAYTYIPKANATGTDSFTFSVNDDMALRFDGVDDYAIAPLNGTSLTQLTLEMWVKPSTIAGGGIFQWADTLNSQLPFIYLQDTGNSLRLYVNGGYPLTIPLSRGQWTHLAVTHDGTSWRLYKDGVLAGTYNGGRYAQDRAKNLYFSNGHSGFWNGQMDEMRVWSVARTQAEIQSGISNPPVGNEAGLLSYYHLTDGPGSTTASNSAVGKSVATLTNMNVTTAWIPSQFGINSNVATISVTITPANDVPVATNGNLSATEDTVATGTLSASDVDGDNLSYSLVADGIKGSVVMNGDGTYTYTPNLNANGADSFTFTANDGTADSNVATITITIGAVDDVPVAAHGSLSATEDTVATGTLSASDMDGDSLTYSLVADGAKGSVVVNADGTYTYTPNLNANGADSFTFTANDGTTDSNIATITVTITEANDAPVVTNTSVSATEDTPASGTLSGTDTEGDSLTYSLVANGIKGEVIITDAATGAYTYTPNPNATGTDSFTFTGNDGTSDSDVATVSITITPINDAPEAMADSFSVAEDGVLNQDASGVLANDTDVEQDPLVVQIVSSTTRGALTLYVNGTFDYTPNANVCGVDSFTYQAHDGALNSITATATITVMCKNDVPVATNGSLTVTEDSAASGTLVGSDVESTNLTYSLVTNGDKGKATITDAATGAYTYTPNPHATGTDSFTFTVSDGKADSNVATVSVTIGAVNDAPVATNGSLSTSEDTSASGTLEASDVDGNSLTYELVANGTKGTVTITNAATGAYTYVPNPNATGTDSFTFTANDGTTNSNVATITVSIDAANDAPVAANGNLGATEDTPADGTLSASDTESDTLSYSLVANGTKGNVLVNGDGTYTYTPNANATGTDSFTFKATDGTADSNVATITVLIGAVNDAPVASNSALPVTEDTSANGTVTASDMEGDNLTYSLVAEGTKGIVVVNTDGTYTYTPNANTNGADSFTFKANDGTANSNIATVMVTIDEVNDAPIAAGDTLSVSEDADTYVIPFAELLGNDVAGPANERDQTLTIDAVTSPTGGTVSIVGTDVVFRPSANYTGSAGFSYTLKDNGTTAGTADPKTATATVDITINGVNDAPTIRGIADQTIVENSATAALDVTVSDVETVAGSLAVTASSSNTALVPHANIVVGGSGADRTLTVTPRAGVYGATTITLTVTDADGGSAETTFALVVNGTPRFVSPSEGAAFNTTSVTLSGQASGDAVVTLTEGTTTLCTVTADPGGNWSCTLTLAAGPHTLTALASLNGVVSAPATRSLTIDLTTPPAPSLGSADTTNDATPIFSGTAEPGSTVTIGIDLDSNGTADVVFTTTVNASGAWSLDTDAVTPTSGTMPSGGLAAGGYGVTFGVTDPAGNTSALVRQTLTITNGALPPPAITTASSTNDPTPRLSGTAEPHSTIAIELDLNGDDRPDVVYTTTANVSGVWTIDLGTATPSSGSLPASGLTDSGYGMRMIATDDTGNVSSAIFQALVIDMGTPATPAVGSAEITNDPTPPLSGVAEPGTVVTVGIDLNGDTTPDVIFTTTTNNAGVWTLDTGTATPSSGSLPASGLANGDYGLTVTSTDAAGNASNPVHQALTIDEHAVTPPTIGSLPSTNDRTPVMNGVAEPGSMVTVALDLNDDGVADVTFTTTASASGAWSLDMGTATPSSGSLPAGGLAHGGYDVTVITTDTAGQTSAPAHLTLTVDGSTPSAPSLGSVAITSDRTPVLSGEAEPGSMVTVALDLNDDGVVDVVYTTIAAIPSGVWVIDTSTAIPVDGQLSSGGLGAGSYELTVTATDIAGNVSSVTSTTLTVDQTTPSVPTLTQPALGTAVSGSPVFGGVAEPGSTVRLSIDQDGNPTTTNDVVTYVTQADSSGVWSVDTATATPVSGTWGRGLSETAPPSVRVTATDAAGNTSGVETAAPTVDVTAPAKPQMALLMPSTDRTPVLSGVADPQSTVTLVIDPDNNPATDNSVVFITTADGDGKWSIDIGTATAVGGSLPVGGLAVGMPTSITITATDAAGNVSGQVTQTISIGLKMYLPQMNS